MSAHESATPMMETTVRVRLERSDRRAKREKMLILAHPLVDGWGRVHSVRFCLIAHGAAPLVAHEAAVFDREARGLLAGQCLHHA